MKKHSRSLVNVLTQLHPVIGVEVGVFRAGNAKALLDSFPALGLHLVDPYDMSITTTLRGDQENLHKVKKEAIDLMHPYSSRIQWYFDTSEIASKNFHDGSVDFVFIDGDHTYESVSKDINLWFPKIKAGGILAGHDYGGRGDRTGRFGVKKAVDEHFEEVNVEPHMIWWVYK